QSNVGDKLSSAAATDANGQTTVTIFGGKQPTQPGPAAAVVFAPEPAMLPMPTNPNAVTINVTVQKVVWTFAGPTAQVISSTVGPNQSDISLTATDVYGNPINALLYVNFWEWGAEAWTAFDTASPLTFGN